MNLVGFFYGGRRPGTNELKPAVVVLDYSEGWIKKKIDPVELVTLRKSGMTLRAMAAQTGINKSTICRYLARSPQGGSFGNSEKDVSTGRIYRRNKRR